MRQLTELFVGQVPVDGGSHGLDVLLEIRHYPAASLGEPERVGATIIGGRSAFDQSLLLQLVEGAGEGRHFNRELVGESVLAAAFAQVIKMHHDRPPAFGELQGGDGMVDCLAPQSMNASQSRSHGGPERAVSCLRGDTRRCVCTWIGWHN